MKKYTNILIGAFVVLGIAVLVSSCDDSGVVAPTTTAGKNVRTYGGASSDELTDMEQVNDGGVLLSGFTVSFGAGNNDFYAIRLTSAGDITWSKAYGSTGNDICTSGIQAGDGGFIFAGNTISPVSNGSDVMLVKTDANGHMTWSFDYSIPNDQYVGSVVQDVDGGFIVCGYSNELDVANSEVMLLKVNSAGAIVWEKLYGGAFNDLGIKMVKTSDGGFLVAGATFSFGATNEDIYMLKLKADCSLDWTYKYGGDAVDQPFDVIETYGHDFLITGYTRSFGLTNGSMLLFKTDHNGVIYTSEGWPRTIGDSSGLSQSLGAALATDGSFYITGYTTNATGNKSLFFAHYFNNSLFDFARSYGTTTNNDMGVAILARSNGFLIAGNTDANGPGVSDFLTIGLPDSSGKYLSCLTENAFTPQGGSPATFSAISVVTMSYTPAAENTISGSITENAAGTMRNAVCGQ